MQSFRSGADPAKFKRHWLKSSLKAKCRTGKLFTMVTENNLIERVCTYENAEKAYFAARKCKRYRPEVRQFEENREINLLRAIHDIKSVQYNSGKYFIFRIYEPKERMIMALPFYDRVVQHMIVNVISPIYEKRFIYHSYACREGKGVHAASKQLADWIYALCAIQGLNVYAYCGDIHNYFGSVDLEILKQENQRYISDGNVIEITGRIINANGAYPEGIGIPVGNLTSQLYANVYLNILDQFVKHKLHEKYHIRYMDNFIILQTDLERLKYDVEEIREFVGKRLRLQINPKSTIVNARNGIDFVGYRHFPEFTIMRKTSTRNFNDVIKDYEKGIIEEDYFLRSAESRLGHMKHADTYDLRRNYRKKVEEAVRIRNAGLALSADIL